MDVNYMHYNPYFYFLLLFLSVFTPMTMHSILFVLVLSFLDSRILLKELRIEGRLNRVATFPTGIDSERFIHALELPQVQENVKNIKETFAGREVRLGVDLLDMIKGILQKILAFEQFIKETVLGRNICPGIICLYLKILFQVILVLLVINAVGHSNASIC
ncbi:alpha,alpha-trehalose-phosphate synthase [UDP-forming] 56 kDa subunit-like isoform X2 [Ziziphus jujuba]|uniref:Alpha,alpha-trehalose-phosphate synthase [UDP-forming] 56 kDa subunit-like isoform X2 n=1 Tax=Ziziphus jujuba TaxID=326968 RepID=A0ABM3ZW38_ZIZJJ|nr:alpha,alpha-trehalose-phosphate synthase [UDP-forming] 56 kDa subunit-like isoform X2 [Ziziphus jujuba]